MIQVLTKWRVVLQFPKDSHGNGLPELQLYISDNFASNVLLKLSEIGFETEPTFITIQPASQAANASVTMNISAIPGLLGTAEA